MPTVYLARGIASARLPSGNSSVSGTATADYSAQPTQVSGTTTCDDTDARPWRAATPTSPVRWTRVRVLLGPDLEDVTGLVGEVEVVQDGEAVVSTASFQLVDSRCAYFAEPSFAAGGLTCQVKLWMADRTGGSEYTLFRGFTEAVQNEDPYCPRATFRAVSAASWYGERGANAGCLRVGAFSLRRRLSLLSDYSAAAGAVLSGLPTGSGTALSRPVDLSGLSVLDLARRWAEIEGYYLRDAAGVLEFVAEDEVVAGASRYSFAPSNCVALKEVAPDHPITTWTLSGQRAKREALDSPGRRTEESVTGGVDSAGKRWETITRITYLCDVEIRREIEEWKDYARLGVTTNRETFQLVRRTLAESFWIGITPEGWYTLTGVVISHTIPTGQSNGTRTTVWELSSPIASTATGYAWTDGSHHVHTSEALRMVSLTEEVLTWDAATCQLRTKTTTTTAYVNPQTAAAAHAFDDGTLRLSASYQWDTASRTTETWTDNAGTDAPYSATYAKSVEAWHTTGWWDDAGTARPVETFGLFEQETETQISLGPKRHRTETQRSAGSESSYSSVVEEGDVQGPETAAPDQPQYAEETMSVTVSGYTGRYPEIRRAETIQDGETTAELVRIGKRRLRDELSVLEIIDATALPQLNVWDPVDVTDPARNLDAKRGVVKRITYRLSVLNGWAGAQFAVAILPEALC